MNSKASVDMPRIDLMGMSFAVLSKSGLIELVSSRMKQGEGGWIMTANLDFFQRFSESADFRTLCQNADIVVADGTPLVWASRLQGTPLPERVTGSDLVWSLTERVAKDGRGIFLLGGNPGAAEGAATRFQELYPGIIIAGTASPMVSTQPLDSELGEVSALLEASQPDVVYVALGTPKTEYLISALRDRFPKIWWMGVGISLSFVTGEVSRSPLWMQRVGLEWFHRLLQEPRRMIPRYMGNIPFAFRLLFSACCNRKESDVVRS